MLFIFLILIVFVVPLLLLKWLDIRSVSELKYTFVRVIAGNGQHLLSNIFRVDENSTRHGGELVASVLKSHNVQEIFVLCGGHISPILVAAQKLGIKIIDTRHEVTAVFAADAVARLRQSIGVAVVTAGPGVTNTITAVKNAQMAESPLLLLGGAAPTLLKGRGALQDIDQLALFRSLCKYVARVQRLRDIVPTLRQAIKTAVSGCPGPVFVEFPVDVLYPYQLVVKEIGFYTKPIGFVQRALNYYLRYHVSRQFSAAWIHQDISPLPTQIPMPTFHEVSKIVQLVCDSKKPLLLIGSQALLPPVIPSRLVKAVELLGIPVFLSGMARGLLGKENNLQMRQNRKEALRDADLTILAGAVCDFRLSYGRILSKKSKIVCINRDHSQLTKNEKTFWTADVSVRADVASTLVEVADQLEKIGYKAPCAWLEDLRSKHDEKEASTATKLANELANDFINPLNFLARLDKKLPDDAILVADGGDFVGSAAYIVRPRGPLQWLDPGAFGTLGVGGGFALGAKVVYPERPVYILWGDGSSGYSIMEYDTFSRHKLPVIGVIGNDACWTQIAREQVPMFGSNVAVDLARTRYDEIAVALGGWGALLSKDNVSTVEKILDEALHQSREGRAALLNVLIGRTDFRDGSISV
ncbi:thiamine pyrophosphate enzyme, TPP binding domain protein [Dictyocaulus viviparus]|uniref:2-hydroxyacyl-CoA lyase 2 n=1 Tax=Dictyocaulus viviparus TaxID=29172 RepID=A0A0D8YB41_DICVI|nr:thiamine pyrophosphate enzyme, TPP binding domain protein [Dictyocaulus viviparus]